MNGTPVNVPATLDHVLKVLPRMPNQLQLHPMKLKRRLEYKSHYMYDVIHKDIIVGALAWLKLHNVHYSCVTVNDTWSPGEGLCTTVDGNKSQGSLQTDDMDNCVGHNNISLLHNSITCGICQCDDNNESEVLPISSEDIINGEDTANRTQVLGNSSNKSTLINNENDTESNSEDERELTEDQAAINKRQDTTGDDLPSVLQIDNLEKEIYQCAPGENDAPKDMLLDDNFEVLTFPDLFPHGKGGYISTERSMKLGIRKYFQQRLLNCNGRFAKNMEYIFCAQYISDIKQIQSDANMAIQLSRRCTLDGSLITAGIFYNPDDMK